ncbi:MAG: RecX family transcriptional regulator [Anaerolineae bacterium]|nr:RecX family transcriptional regulator [Anaerolineae bacterium]
MAGRITAIKIQKKDRERASIFIDGQFAFGLALVEAARLRTGQHLSDEDIAALQTVDEQARAYEFALDFLSYRPRSQAEVARRLRDKEFLEPTIEYVLQRLSRAGLIDDVEFARYWIGNREQFKPRGMRALRYELREKGIANDIVEELLQDLDQTDSAHRAAAPKIRRWRQLDPLEFRRKLAGFLQRRGFTYNVIAEVWERIQTDGEATLPDNDEREDQEVWDQEV